ncbi:glyoxalase/bleomycin resistance/extradiol dioxygenase family protein [Prolixibacteraceae bacterium JC049]|nr:glyoxalase/bleomycin resistance/extradiol dioxygenase family protein [Prolixibacteraceae bacterium JC049]
MKIEHLAIWAKDLEMVKEFYIKYFGMKCNEKYTNTKKNFTSYFLSFEEGATRIEIMNRPEIKELAGKHAVSYGLTHFSISLGSKHKVDELTEKLRNDGYNIVGEPRTTGDGYYESVIEDCEGNWVEITE